MTYTNVDTAPDQRTAAHALREAAPWLTKADHKRRRKAYLRAFVRSQRFLRHPPNRINARTIAQIGRYMRALRRIKARLGAHAWAAEYLCRPKR